MQLNSKIPVLRASFLKVLFIFPNSEDSACFCSHCRCSPTEFPSSHAGNQASQSNFPLQPAGCSVIAAHSSWIEIQPPPGSAGKVHESKWPGGVGELHSPHRFDVDSSLTDYQCATYREGSVLPPDYHRTLQKASLWLAVRETFSSRAPAIGAACWRSSRLVLLQRLLPPTYRHTLPFWSFFLEKCDFFLICTAKTCSPRLDLGPPCKVRRCMQHALHIAVTL